MTFDYSQLKRGDSVEVSTQPDFSNPVAGTVTKVEADCAFIQVLGSPNPPLEFCWHLEDERMAEGHERFNAQQELLSGDGEQGPRSGVFIKSRNQELIESLPERLDAIERLLTTLGVRVSALERDSEPGGSEPPRRKRGRPRKPETVGAA
jgi:hypothetical protein